MIVRGGTAPRVVAPRRSPLALLPRLRDFDGYMFVTTIVLMGFGIVAVASASGVDLMSLSNPGVRQAALGLIGVLLSVVIAAIDYRLLVSAAWVLYYAGLVLLGLVLVPGIGAEIQGGRRWFDLGFATIQPSEFVKLTTTIALAAFLSARADGIVRFGDFLLSLAIVAAPMALIVAEPDFDASLIFVVIWGVMMLLARPRRLFVVALAAAAPPLAALTYFFVLQDFHRLRIQSFLGFVDDPLGASFQATQAKISIGSGGWFGNGLWGGTPSQLNLLGVRTTDFIFAHASSMFGFVGMLAMLACFVFLLFRFLRVVEVAKDAFGQYFALGITALVFCQALINIGMNLGLFPVAGIPLPFVSVGVSSLWTMLVAEGILQSILLHRRKLGFRPD